MAKKARPARPKDANKLAKHIADIATGKRPNDSVKPETNPSKKIKKTS